MRGKEGSGGAATWQDATAKAASTKIISKERCNETSERNRVRFTRVAIMPQILAEKLQTLILSGTKFSGFAYSPERGSRRAHSPSGFALCVAANAAGTRLHVYRCAHPGDRNWRHHRDLHAGTRHHAEVAAGR